MPQTLSDKIIAKAAGVNSVTPGEIVTCSVDLAMAHDSSGPRASGRKLDELGVPVWDPDRYVVVTDHYVNLSDENAIEIQRFSDEWTKAHGVRNYLKEQGICHVVLPERGFLRPGMFCVGADSHSTTGGAVGAFMVGVGATEMTGVLATGEIWVRAPETVRVEVTGRLAAGVAAKDVVLSLCARVGIMGFNYQAIEYAGDGVTAMSLQERMVLTNMAAELGGKTGIVAPDETTRDALAAWGVAEEDIDLGTWQSDANAQYARVEVVDGAALAPQVAAPHSPENSASVDRHAGVRLDQAYIGACTGAKLEDLHMAAAVMKGRKVASGTTFHVAPATLRMRERAAADGTLKTLEEAGAVILPPGCGGCIGLGPAGLAENAVGVSSTNRNFVGRAGHKTSRLYLASPFTVAASAAAGEIADPREFL